MIKLNTMNSLLDTLMIQNLSESYKLKYPVDLCYVGENDIRLIENRPKDKMKVNAFDLSQKGGAWLGSVRNWIQCKCVNGSSVTWGSQEQLKPRSLTVQDLEQLAATIAAAAINEYIERGER